MLDFIRSVYRGFVLIAFWIILIGFAVGGGIIGNALSDYNRVGGVIIGLIIGFILDILLCGYIATILNMDKKLEEQNELLMQQINLSCKNGKIILKRISSDKDTDKSINISIDDKQKIHLSNGEEKTIDLEGGNHKIFAEYDDGTTYTYNEYTFSNAEKAEAKFTINNNVKNINISIDPELKIEIV
jgi:uncharacterized membrane protein required for colicin V production